MSSWGQNSPYGGAPAGSYGPNSHKAKQEQAAVEKKKASVQKVISGTARTRKKKELTKLAEVFISEDVSNVKSYLLMDVLVPAVKQAVSDIVTRGIEMLLYGEQRRSTNNYRASNTSYRNYYDDRNRNQHIEPRTKAGYDYNDVVVDSRGEAEEVLQRMGEIIETYGEVTVADMYDLVGVTGKYTDNNYGWTNIRNAEVIRVRDGYMLKMPRVTPTKR